MTDQPVISIVDDDPSVREAMMDLVNSLGLSAAAFGTAEAFLESRTLPSTACLIVDVQMPGMSGLELRRRLVEAGSAVSTIVITAYPDERIRREAMKVGAIGYLIKPFSDEALIGCIDKALGQRKAS